MYDIKMLCMVMPQHALIHMYIMHTKRWGLK